MFASSQRGRTREEKLEINFKVSHRLASKALENCIFPCGKPFSSFEHEGKNLKNVP